MIVALARLWCGFRGHEFAYVPAPQRLYLVCIRCGRVTPGWEVAPKAAVATKETL